MKSISRLILTRAHLLACLLVACAGISTKASAQCDYISATTYLDFAVANGFAQQTFTTNLTTVLVGTNITVFTNVNVETKYDSGYLPTDDKDGDGLTNFEEFNGWSSTVNGVPVHFGWNSATATSAGSCLDQFDSDGDGLSDLYESGKVGGARTNPQSGDTDGDGMGDAWEVHVGLDPRDDGTVNPDNSPDADPDGDGLTNNEERRDFVADPATAESPINVPPLGEGASYTLPLNYDSDGDRLIDSFELGQNHNLDPTSAQEEGNDADADPDRDGLTTYREQCIHPLMARFWSTGLPDISPSVATESIGYGGYPRKMLVASGYLNLAQWNATGDDANTLGNVIWGHPVAEPAYGGIRRWTNPNNHDTDLDLMPDGWEVEHGLNPLSGANFQNGKRNVSGALGDPDLDGLYNIEEYFGADGYRIDFITGTGDETVPWIIRAFNNTHRSEFAGRIGQVGMGGRGDQSPVGYGEDFITNFAPDLFPGFFDPVSFDGGINTPVPGVPPFVFLTFTDTFNPFATAITGILFEDLDGDFRYTLAGGDNLWFDANADGFFNLGEPILAGTPGDGVSEGDSIVLNYAVRYPLDGFDTDNDGISDFDEVYAEYLPVPERVTSPVHGTSPFVKRSARITSGAGVPTPSLSPRVEGRRFFSRSFTIESWVYLSSAGGDDYQGSLVRGDVFLDTIATETRTGFDLGIRQVGTTNAVPYFAYQPLNGVFTISVAAPTKLPLDEWVHLAGVFDQKQNRMALYVNGVLARNRTSLPESSATYGITYGGQLTLARDAGTGTKSFADNLWIDEVRVWGIPLPVETIQDNRNRLIDVVQQVKANDYYEWEDDIVNGLFAYYTFDDGGDSADDFARRSKSSLVGYSYPHDPGVLTFPDQEYLYGDGGFTLASDELLGPGAAFVFDTNAAPVSGQVTGVREGAFDSDRDGLPDDWEIIHELNPFRARTWDHVQFSQYDPGWASTNDPPWASSGDPANDGQRDVDGDGITNIGEYQLGLNPRDGEVDILLDLDGDGLANIEEFVLGTDPLNPDTDDDGYSDADELNPNVIINGQKITSPTDSRSPLIQRSAVLDGTAITVPGPGFNDRFTGRSGWAIEAWVNLADESQTGSLIRRDINSNGQINFELRVDANVPSAQFTTAGGMLIKAGVDNIVLPSNTWVHLAASWDVSDKSLTLYINGRESAEQVSLLTPASGRGVTVLGDGVSGLIDEVRFWNKPRNAESIEFYLKRHIFTTAQPEDLPPLDISFIIDVSGSMGPFLTQVKSNITTFVRDLSSRGYNVQLAGVRYSDTLAGGGGSADTPPSGDGFYDRAEVFLAEWLTPLALEFGGDGPEDGLGGLLYALDGNNFNPTFNDDAQKIFILLTDASVKDREDGDTGALLSRKDVIAQLNEAGVIVEGIYRGAADVAEIVEATGGSSYDIDTPDYAELFARIIESILAKTRGVSAYYPFDDGENITITNAITGLVTGYGAEDFSNRRDWSFALAPITFSTNAPVVEGDTDMNLDGLPDWWQDLFMPGRITTATNDLDGDGLLNIHEYLLGWNPLAKNTDNDDVPDYDEDSDGDGISDGNELYVYFTDPLSVDTDDDGISDGDELANSTDPTSSYSPAIPRAMQFSGDGRLVVRNSDESNSSRDWTVEAWVLPASASETGIIIRRAEKVGVSGQRAIDYELGLDGNIPYITYAYRQDGFLITERVDGIKPIDEIWTHVAGVYDSVGQQLRLYVNGKRVDYERPVHRPLISGFGMETTIGGGDHVAGAIQDGLSAQLDAVRVWDYARSGLDIQNARGELFPEFLAGIPDANRAPLRLFNFDDGGEFAEDSVYQRDWETGWRHAATLENDAAFVAAPFPPASLDSDDDTITDKVEATNGWPIRRSDKPFTYHALNFDGTGDVYIDELVDNDETALYALTNWTVETWVRPTSLPAGRQPLVQRVEKSSGLITFEVGIVNTAGVVHPYTRFNRDDAGNDMVMIQHATALPVGSGSNDWSHVAATFNNGSFSLFVNGGMIRMDDVIGASPHVGGPGELKLGSVGFTGQMQEARIWNTPRDQYQIMDSYRRNLIFSAPLLESSFDGRYAFLGRQTVSREDGLIYDFTQQASIAGLPYTAGRRTHKFTIQSWVRLNAGSSGGIVAERKIDVQLNPEAPDWRINHSLRVGNDGRPQGIWDGQVRVINPVRRDVTNDVSIVDRLDATVENVSRNITSDVDIRDGEWHHLALVGDGETVALYIDGILNAQANSYYTFRVRENDQFESLYSSYAPIGSVLRVADGSASPYYLEGLVDEVSLWNDALSVDEIRQHRDFGLDKSDIKAGLDAIDPLPVDAIDPGAPRQRLVSYLTFDGDVTLPFVTDRASDVAYRLMPIAPSGSIRGQSKPPVVSDPAYIYDRDLRGYFAGTDGGEHVENYMQRNDYGYAGAFRSTGIGFVAIPANEITHIEIDTDGDGLPDWWESLHGLDPSSAEGVNGAWGDIDGDGLNNRAEYLAGTDPRNFDSNNDGISDADSRTNSSAQTWVEIYTDNDGMDDAWEVLYPTAVSPLLYDAHLDPDGDGWSNYAEFMAKTDPSDPRTYPLPRIPIRVDYDSFLNAGGPLVLNIYSTPKMDGEPDAIATANVLINRSGRVGAISQLGNTASGTITELPVVRGSVKINVLCEPFTVLEFEDLGAGIMRSIGVIPERLGMIDYETGAFTLFLSPTSLEAGQPVCAEWQTYREVREYPFDGQVAITKGYVREGPMYIFGFIDNNDNQTWDTGEPAGLLQQQPVNVSWGELPQVRLSLTDEQPGYMRFNWTASAGLASTVTISRTTADGLPVLIDYVVRNRSYFHEGDFQAAGVFGLPVISDINNFRWTVRNQSGVFSGTNAINYGASLPAPVPLLPAGESLTPYALTMFEFIQGSNAVNFRLQIRSGSTNGTIVFDQTTNAPYRNPRADFRTVFRPPFYMGDGAFTNGTFFWRVMSMNGRRDSAWSPYQQFAVKLDENPVGAYMISGALDYFGCAIASNVVVQAFESSGFSGWPAAQVTRSGSGAYALRGLRAGTYHVRAFLDQNRNGRMDPWESWGMVKDYIFLTDYDVKPLPVPGNKANQRLILRDRDINNNNVPDACEYQATGGIGINQVGWDSDGDGLTDWSEIFIYGTDPYNTDTSGDGLTDKQKVDLGLDPLDNDFDNDGYSDVLELLLGSDPKSPASVPPVSSHFVITGILPEIGGVRVYYDRDPLVTSIAFNIVASVAGATNVAGPYIKLPGSENPIFTNTWLMGPWNYFEINGADPSAFYQIQWTTP